VIGGPRKAALAATVALLPGCAAVVPPATTPAPTVEVARPAAPVALQPIRWTGRAIQGGLITGIAPAGTQTLALDGKPVPVAPDGRFVIGFDRDAAPAATLVATAGDGRSTHVAFSVAARAWDISRLPTLPKVPVPQPEFAARRPGELAQIVAARAMRTDAAGWAQAFHWPTTGRISTLFGSQRIYANGEAGSYHSGIDIARVTGTPVQAPADGVVILAAAAPFTLEGNLLMIDHGMGLNSAFLHLSRINVSVGDHVTQGQVVGFVGATGRATGPHLHWSLQWQGAKLDPLLAAGPMP
jgi:murein DD-endopeptidase MepM/ murein hydrolase activator NlpD